jgi:hypothetical protein
LIFIWKFLESSENFGAENKQKCLKNTENNNKTRAHEASGDRKPGATNKSFVVVFLDKSSKKEDQIQPVEMIPDGTRAQRSSTLFTASLGLARLGRSGTASDTLCWQAGR